VLNLGLSLWGALTPQQRVALLGHELGHFSNGDIRRGFLVQPCLTTLGRLSDLFGGRSRRSARGNIVGIVQPLADALMRVLSFVFYLGNLGVQAVGLREAQRAEYLADQRAAALAGTRATAELLDLLGSNIGSVIASRARALNSSSCPLRTARSRSCRSTMFLASVRWLSGACRPCESVCFVACQRPLDWLDHC
jgi:Zn-dependent protease with chaperone function